MCLAARALCACISCALTLGSIVYVLYALTHSLSSEAAQNSLAAAVARRVGRQAARAAANNVLATLGDDDD